LFTNFYKQKKQQFCQYKNKTAFKIHKKTILMLIRDECQINQNKFQTAIITEKTSVMNANKSAVE
jgi:hypothetical protein